MGPMGSHACPQKPAAHSPHPHTSMDMDACTPLASSTPVVVGRRVKSSDRDGSSVPFVWLNRTSLPRIVDDEALTARSDPGTIILGFGRSIEEGQLTFYSFQFFSAQCSSSSCRDRKSFGCGRRSTRYSFQQPASTCSSSSIKGQGDGKSFGCGSIEVNLLFIPFSLAC